jgi:signal transduction histidine kinase/CheY-like chemotaxis protein
VLYEPQIFASRRSSVAYRISELVLCALLLALVAKKRPARQIEWGATFGFCALNLAHGYAILIVRPDCVAPFTLTLEWSQMVIVLASLLSLRPTLVLLAETWLVGAIATLVRAKFDTDFSDHVVLFSIYGVLVASVASFDRLRRREFLARTRLDEANRALRRADEVRSRLFVNLSHDLRTPLALIHAETELIDQDESGGDRAEALERIRAHTSTLADLTDQLLELARLEAGKTPISPQSFDVRGLIGRLALELAVTGTRIAVDGSVGICADPRHVRRILTNLLSNAERQAAHAGGGIRVSARASDTCGVIDVIDDGPGVPRERRREIFERFASFDRAGGVASGIGLPVARELAELNGGTLELVEGAPNTTFRLRLPLAEGVLADVPASAPLSAGRSGVHEPRRAAPPGRRTLLVVEDHPEMRRLLERLLEHRFEVRCVPSCAAARIALAATAPSAVLCDVLLPDGSGHSVLELVRSQPHLDGVPFVFVSALADAEHRALGLLAGADDYVSKPFSTREMVARIEAACSRAEDRRRTLEAQRVEIVAELHDGVATSLSRAALLLASSGASASETSLRARECVHDALVEARSILAIVEGGSVGWENTVAELRADLEEGVEGHHATAQLVAQTDGSSRHLSQLEHHTLRRLGREALTNALKHARPTVVRCEIGVLSGELVVSFENDGVLPSAKGDECGPSGRGHSILSRRIERLGGSMHFDRLPGGRAHLLARFPLQRRDVGPTDPALANRQDLPGPFA